MDLSALFPASGLAGVGVGGLLVMVVAYLLNANRVDRREYQEAVDRAEGRADKADARAEGLQAALDEARAARRVAEDRADQLARELARCRADAGGGP